MTDNAAPPIVNAWTMAEAVIVVTGYLGQPNRFLKLGRDLIAAGATPGDILALYGEGGRYWLEDWRGKNGQRPSEHAIRETVNDYLHSTAPRVAVKQVKSADALAEWMTQTGADLNG